MRLELLNHPAVSGVDLVAPGITIGSASGNGWVPDPDDQNLGAVQAAVRAEGDDFVLVNLGSRHPVSVNGDPIPRLGSVRLVGGDRIALGACLVSVVPHAATDQDGVPETATNDVFADLIGPGTLPLGATPAVQAHPFALDSAAVRNAQDPLAHLPPARSHPPVPHAVDPMASFGQDTPMASGADEVPDVFTDDSPSVLDRQRGSHAKS